MHCSCLRWLHKKTTLSCFRRPVLSNLIFEEGHAASELVEVGTQEIVDAVGSVLSLQGRRATALVRAFRAGQLREDFELIVARAFWVELRRWMTRLADRAVRMSAGQAPPTLVYYRDLSHSLPEAKQALETPFWEQKTGADCCPEIIELDASHARNALDCTARATDPGYLLLRAVAHTVAGIYSQGQDLERLLVKQVCSRYANMTTKRSR